MQRLMLHLFFITVFGTIFGSEPALSNIEQLTTPAMGFEKAGEAYFAPGNKKISFQAVPKGEKDYQIFTLDLETREIAQISQNAGACTCSYFHPNGQKMIFAASPRNAEIAAPGTYKWDFTRYMNIYETNTDGSGAVALTYGPAYHAECAYSPDGSEIVYASDEDGSMNLYIMNSDGSNVRQITHTTHCYNGGSFFSPDGKKVIFRADRDIPDLLQIYMIDTDGTNLVQLTDNNAVNWAPYWHPSGKAFAYTTSIHGHHNYQIYFLNIETKEHYRLTHCHTFDGLPVFNNEGTKLLWTSKRGPDNTSQIFIADLNIPLSWLETNENIIHKGD